MHKYTVLLIPDQEEGGYMVTVPALPGCVAQGDTLEQALQRVREAIQCHIEGLQADGLTVPQEHESPALVKVEVAG